MYSLIMVLYFLVDEGAASIFLVELTVGYISRVSSSFGPCWFSGKIILSLSPHEPP